MAEFYDALETRDEAAREQEQFARLPDQIAHARSAPGWAKQLAGIDPTAVTSRAALATLPVLRKSDLKDLQQADPPFGGLAVTPPGKVKRLLMSPGPIFEPQGQGADWWAPRGRFLPRASAPATSCTMRSPITSRLADSFSRPAPTRSVAP